MGAVSNDTEQEKKKDKGSRIAGRRGLYRPGYGDIL